MFQYRKILELHSEKFSLRSIASATDHSQQKVTNVILKAEKHQVSYPYFLEENGPMSDETIWKAIEIIQRRIDEYKNI